MSSSQYLEMKNKAEGSGVSVTRKGLTCLSYTVIILFFVVKDNEVLPIHNGDGAKFGKVAKAFIDKSAVFRSVIYLSFL